MLLRRKDERLCFMFDAVVTMNIVFLGSRARVAQSVRGINHEALLKLQCLKPSICVHNTCFREVKVNPPWHTFTTRRLYLPRKVAMQNSRKGVGTELIYHPGYII